MFTLLIVSQCLIPSGKLSSHCEIKIWKASTENQSNRVRYRGPEGFVLYEWRTELSVLYCTAYMSSLSAPRLTIIQTTPSLNSWTWAFEFHKLNGAKQYDEHKEAVCWICNWVSSTLANTTSSASLWRLHFNTTALSTPGVQVHFTFWAFNHVDHINVGYMDLNFTFSQTYWTTNTKQISTLRPVFIFPRKLYLMSVPQLN